ncbi:claudin-18 [Protobothrops mucrosquamatus]|uniref:claudin-18 n=1 Tax=Protobothrops mucrosquamatus TaxID=103944 RepID=UPI000775E874|nr:claudin-18 [Protobothrops mucrosquamatus]
MSTTLCQVLGFCVAALGFAGCIAATAMDPWSTQDLYNNPVTSLFLYQGLWRTCVSQSSGLTECRPYYTILGLPAMLQAVRALMIVGIVLGAFGLLVATFSLKCLRMGSMEDSAKASMTLAAGVMCIVSGICAICGVSVFANMLVTDYWMSTANMYQPGMMQSLSVRYTFGAALFVGWVAGGLAFVGGILMCVACRGLVPEETHYKAVSYKSAGYKSGTAYETKKTPVMDNNTVKSDEGRRSYPSKYDYV